MTKNYAAKARSLRITANAMFITSGALAVFAVIVALVTGNVVNLLSLASAAIIVTSGMSLRTSASGYDRLARR